MARHIVLASPQRGRTSLAGFQKSSRYDAAAPLIEAMKPDEAIFFSSSDLNADPRLVVVRLAGALRLRFPGFVTIKDFDKGGVWLYRPAFRGAGSGRAIGPQKEAEIMKRRINKVTGD